MSIMFVRSGCRNKIPLTGGLRRQTSDSPRCWALEVQARGSADLVSGEDSPPCSQKAIGSLQPHTVLPQCVCRDTGGSLLSGTEHSGVPLTRTLIPTVSFSLATSFLQVQPDWEPGPQHMNLGEHERSVRNTRLPGSAAFPMRHGAVVGLVFYGREVAEDEKEGSR